MCRARKQTRHAAAARSGDVRMRIAEDSNKVQRIVQGSYRALAALYSPRFVAQALQECAVEVRPEQPLGGQRFEFERRDDKDADVALLSRLPWVRGIHDGPQACCMF